jgi:hypothetical protein
MIGDRNPANRHVVAEESTTATGGLDGAPRVERAVPDRRAAA